MVHLMTKVTFTRKQELLNSLSWHSPDPTWPEQDSQPGPRVPVMAFWASFGQPRPNQAPKAPGQKQGGEGARSPQPAVHGAPRRPGRGRMLPGRTGGSWVPGMEDLGAGGGPRTHKEMAGVTTTPSRPAGGV